jgi:hypothetical protein
LWDDVRYRDVTAIDVHQIVAAPEFRNGSGFDEFECGQFCFRPTPFRSGREAMIFRLCKKRTFHCDTNSACESVPGVTPTCDGDHRKHSREEKK